MPTYEVVITGTVIELVQAETEEHAEVIVVNQSGVVFDDIDSVDVTEVSS